MAWRQDIQLEDFLRDEMGDLRQHLINEATTPSEKALLLIALEVAELRKTLAHLVASGSAVEQADRVAT
jgi:hypothetical protein